jgi:tetratricopeptide (TPR) repeat protein
MLPHQSFYDVLSEASEGLPVWAPTLAGLAVLHLLDAARTDRAIIDEDWTGVKITHDAVTSLREGTPLRRPLQRILDNLRDAGPSWFGVNQALFAYGRALDLEGNWSLAADVFTTVAEIAREERDASLAIEATTALGGAARRSGDWDRSADSYATAGHLADALGDRASGLTVRVGTANTHIARGNLPAARMVLDEVIDEAGAAGLDGVQALAYHARASVAHLQGEFADAVSLAYKALGKATNPSARDSINADIAAAFMELGMHDAARDAYLIVSATSRYQWVRWQATVNLMELAAIDGMEEAFESYAKELKNAALDPRLRSYFLLYYGRGAISFGREEEGRRSISDAQDFASRHKINQVAHEASAALAAGKEARDVKRSAVGSVPKNVVEVAEAMTHLRQLALSSPSRVSDWLTLVDG